MLLSEPGQLQCDVARATPAIISAYDGRQALQLWLLHVSRSAARDLHEYRTWLSPSHNVINRGCYCITHFYELQVPWPISHFLERDACNAEATLTDCLSQDLWPKRSCWSFRNSQQGDLMPYNACSIAAWPIAPKPTPMTLQPAKWTCLCNVQECAEDFPWGIHLQGCRYVCSCRCSSALTVCQVRGQKGSLWQHSHVS